VLAGIGTFFFFQAEDGIRDVAVANVDRFTKARWKGAATEIVSTVRSAHWQHKHELDAQVRQAYERVEDETPTLLALPASAVPNGRQVLSLVDAQLPWLPSTCLNVHLAGPVRVAVRGPNGCGKSTLLKVLAGQWQVVAGECNLPLPCAYIDQHLALLDDRRSRSEEHTSELQSRLHLVCRLLLEKKKSNKVCKALSAGKKMKVPDQEDQANYGQAAAVTRRGQELTGFTGCKGSVDGRARRE